MQVAQADDRGTRPLFEGVSDLDLVDGAGQVILEFLEANLGEMDQMGILDVQDLMRAWGSAGFPVREDIRVGGVEAVLIRALRLLKAGYYRSLLIEERERVGKIDYRLEAMMRFRERILRADADGAGSDQTA
jgi:hypothetical protein